MGIYLKIGNTDVSGFVTENKYSCVTSPVYDEESSFINIFGKRVRVKTGYETDISAVLYDVDDVTAAALRENVSGELCSVSYAAPDVRSGVFETVKFGLSLDRVYRGERFWTAEVRFHAFTPNEDGL
ncbi:MAG: hypothetical protein NC120_09785 [Ruminococcus sp.]|nr:hypothetical protein [Ruminococcus sp.]